MRRVANTDVHDTVKMTLRIVHNLGEMVSPCFMPNRDRFLQGIDSHFHCDQDIELPEHIHIKIINVT